MTEIDLRENFVTKGFLMRQHGFNFKKPVQ